MVEAPGSDGGDVPNVLVTTIAGCCEHDDAPAVRIEAVDHVANRLYGRGVVRIVEYHPERMLVVDVHASGRLEESRVESAQAVANVLQADTHVVGERSRKHCVLHVVHCPPFQRRGNQVRP